MDCLSKEEALSRFQYDKDDTKYCPECLTALRLVDRETYYCPNEMCLREDQYNLEGNVIPLQNTLD